MHSDRIFQGESTFPDHEEWFYRTREGVAGPYLSRDDAALALRRFIKYCQENRLDGGRAARVQRGSRKIANRMALALSQFFNALTSSIKRKHPHAPTASRRDSRKGF